MEPNLKNLFDSAKRTTLTDTERASLKARFAALPRTVRSPYVFLYSKVLHQVVAVTLIVVLVGSSTALAASNALPGDVLFPVKIHVNERVESLLAVTPEAQARVAAVQAERRLGEAEELAHKGRLTEEVTDEVEQQFTEKATEVHERVRELRKSDNGHGADEVEHAFKQTIDKHLESFTQLENGDGSTTPGVTRVRDSIERHSGSGKDDRNEKLESGDLGGGSNSGSGKSDESGGNDSRGGGHDD